VSSVSQSEIELLKGLRAAINIDRTVYSAATINSLTRLAYAGYIKIKNETATSALCVISERGLKALDAAASGNA